MRKRKITDSQKEPGSFRDPSGYIFYQNDQVYRFVSHQYAEEYQLFNSSGLHQALSRAKVLLPFEEDATIKKKHPDSYKILKTPTIPFISYPYEWSFSQLQDAALTTLLIQQTALEHGMSLKDASAFNIQFYQGNPVHIDHLSFEKYQPDSPWVAYKQFCQHFLAPLLLMAKVDVRLNQLLRTNIDGIPLDLTSTLLPLSSYISPSIASHIHLHARNQKQYSGNQREAKKQVQQKLSKILLLGIIDNLKTLIQGLQPPHKKTEWGTYYSFTNYSSKAFEHKKKIISKYILQAKPNSVWDLGGNTGEFSRLASDKNIFTVCFDIDPEAVQENYKLTKLKNESYMLPLLLDLTNQTPNLGWALEERKSLIKRGPADIVMALALVHHLALSNNVPFEMIASLFHQLGKKLIIEFVPKHDTKVQILLATRKDIFPNYTEESFEKAFSRYFTIVKKDPIKHGSVRTMYLMERK